MIAPKLYPSHSLLWDYHIWFTPTSWGMQLGHTTRPGHCNMQHWKFSSDWSCMCVSWSLSYSTLFQSDLLPSTFRACTPVMQVPLFPSALGNIKHLCEWGTSSWGWAIYCPVECITPSCLNFFQFGENTQWIMDGFALGRMCARCVDIDCFCTKAPWV
jgi:hypothetical protein